MLLFCCLGHKGQSSPQFVTYYCSILNVEERALRCSAFIRKGCFRLFSIFMASLLYRSLFCPLVHNLSVLITISENVFVL
ncbi:hypothetical protein XELAEV_18044901mg [Xenopus laevis]|uniref:Uncharacterized protein n=1 Tax=Xenopus laevis TaxID=8355 RepID=A0A974BZR8_XENLA|nr:hypothetical protein XELAEV_18044901mg [Xenopus laevis]